VEYCCALECKRPNVACSIDEKMKKLKNFVTSLRPFKRPFTKQQMEETKQWMRAKKRLPFHSQGGEQKLTACNNSGKRDPKKEKSAEKREQNAKRLSENTLTKNGTSTCPKLPQSTSKIYKQPPHTQKRNLDEAARERLNNAKRYEDLLRHQPKEHRQRDSTTGEYKAELLETDFIEEADGKCIKAWVLRYLSSQKSKKRFRVFGRTT
jgi:hypothetical protein